MTGLIVWYLLVAAWFSWEVYNAIYDLEKEDGIAWDWRARARAIVMSMLVGIPWIITLPWAWYKKLTKKA